MIEFFLSHPPYFRKQILNLIKPGQDAIFSKKCNLSKLNQSRINKPRGIILICADRFININSFQTFSVSSLRHRPPII